ncbi:MAG: ankyrin repeat domain-containing protein, partial [Leptospiraceae bacterium]|nr:ankyrin repeat domain-containing protein [Leptospiraceae bacterium]
MGHLEREFLDAAKRGDLRKLRLALENGVDINTKDEQSQATALILAANKGHLEIVKFLLDNRANVYLEDEYGWTPLFFA